MSSDLRRFLWVSLFDCYTATTACPSIPTGAEPLLKSGAKFNLVGAHKHAAFPFHMLANISCPPVPIAVHALVLEIDPCVGMRQVVEGFISRRSSSFGWAR